MARRGAGNVRDTGDARPGSASGEWRRAVENARGTPSAPPAAWEPEVWVDEGPVRDEATRAVARANRPADDDPGSRDDAPADDRRTAAPDRGTRSSDGARRTRPPSPTPTGRRPPSRSRGDDDETEPAPRRATRPAPPVDVDDPATTTRELARAVGSQRAARFEHRLRDAAEAFEAERFRDARSILRPLADQAPLVPAIRELYGLTLYRLGRWRDAARELEAFRELTGSTEQHPVLADAYRALGRHSTVEELWEELAEASPSAPLVTEGRIVMAGSLADRGDLKGAIRLLERGMKPVKRARDHHLRLWYALARRYEDAGELPRARELLSRVAAADPGFADAAERLGHLGA